jgi:hypothetical protein
MELPHQIVDKIIDYVYEIQHRENFQYVLIEINICRIKKELDEFEFENREVLQFLKQII